MNKLSVGLLVSQFPSIVQPYITNSIAGLQRNDIIVSVIATKKPDHKILPALDAYETPQHIQYIDTKWPKLLLYALSIPVHSLAYWKIVIKIIKCNILSKYGLKYFVKSLIRAKVARKFDYDIIHGHNITLCYDFLFLKEIFDIPFFTTFHGKEPKGSKTLPPSKQKYLFAHSDLFFVNTNYAKRSLVELGCPEDKIFILPQGTNMDAFPFKDRNINANQEINLLTVGRLSKEKGQHISIKAMELICKKFPKVKYHLVGDGPERENLINLINKLSLGNIVILHGHVSRKKLLTLYGSAHIFIFPSVDLKDGLHVETQGVALQEAQASGLPVIASKTGGIPEVITDKSTGRLFKEGDHAELSAAITDLILNRKLYEQLKFGGWEHAKSNFSYTTIGLKLTELYQKSLN